MKTSQWRRAVKNRCVFSVRLKVLSGDCSAGGRRFHVAGPLTAKLRCPVAVRVRGTIEYQSLQIADVDDLSLQ